ncbi:MAG TPA: magnesium transporter, partial [Gammaproteobacteria bacterium]|nr:magnesium transporter [Gammaproteobacteria bacterium]
MAEELEEKTGDRLDDVIEAFQGESLQEVHRQVNKLHPAEIAHLLESLPADERESIWELVDPEIDGEVLLHLNDEVRSALI